MAETTRFVAGKRCTNDNCAEIIATSQRNLAGLHPLYLKWRPPAYRYFYYRVLILK